MGSVGGMLGLGGGAGGTGFSTPSGTNGQQLQTAYGGVQNSLQQQQSLLQALQGQNGIGNQSNVYNQLQGVVSGQGPNPAQAQLAQATGANVANQAALMAGQRGASQNAGLIARQSAMQGANIQQQAAGQGATMQAQQSLNALGQAGGLATTMAGQQIGQANTNAESQLAEQGQLQGANSSNNAIQGQLANTTLGGQQKVLGGLGNALGSVAGLADGGEVPNMAAGGKMGPQSSFAKYLYSFSGTPTFSAASNDGQIGENWKAKPNKFASQNANIKSDANKMVGSQMGSAGSSDLPMPNAAGGGQVPAMVSPGEKFLKPNEAKAVAKGQASPDQVGEKIPGQAKVKGDSLKNDTVPKKLDVGGIVIPRSVMNSKNPEKSAADFVRAVMAKKGKLA